MNGVDAICRMVQVGFGIAVIPAPIGGLYEDTLHIKVIPLTDSWAWRDLVIVWKNNNELSAAARAAYECFGNPG